MSDANATAAVESEILQIVSFTVGEEEFGVDILRVQEINRMLDVTRVPNAPAYVEGVINLRGKVIAVIDLRAKMGLPKKEHGKHTRIIVVEVKGSIVGFVVDAVKEVLRIPRSVTEPPPSLDGSSNREYITAIGKLEDRLLILLDPDQLISRVELESVEGTA
jgi:purine-binding chemotaxis protein CheW